MPLIQITLLQGRTCEQKRKIAQRITDVVSEEGRTPREAIIVAFHEVSNENYAVAGHLVADKLKHA